MRARDLYRRVAEVMGQRRWIEGLAEDARMDVHAVLCMAVACEIAGAGGTRVRRPAGAPAKWPEEWIACPACNGRAALGEPCVCAMGARPGSVSNSTWPAWYIIQELELEELTK